MKAKIDIFLGLWAWLLALTCLYLEFCIDIEYETELKFTVIPVTWTFSVITMVVFRRRPLRKLWWVWPSAPFAFLLWIIGGLAVAIWSYGSFAP